MLQLKNAFLLLFLFAPTARAAGPIIWYGTNSKDLTSAGLITPALTINQVIPGNPANYVAIDVSPTEASGVNGFTGHYEHPNINMDGGSYYGVRIAPTVVGTSGGENAYGLSIDMSGVNIDSQEYAVSVLGDSAFQGRVGINNNEEIQDETPLVFNNFSGNFTVPAASTYNDTIGYNVLSNTTATIGDGTTFSSYGVNGFGITPSISALTVNIGAASTLDYANANVATAIVSGGSGAGTISNLSIYKAVPNDESSGTATVTNMRGFEYEEPNGAVGTNRWAFYNGSVQDSYFSGAVKIGPGEDTPSIADGLEVERTILLKSPAGATLPQPTLQFTEDPDTGTDTVSIQAPASLAAAYTLTLPVDDGNNGQVLSTNGSGVLSWASDVGFANPMDGAGQMIYGGTSGAPTKLAAGTSTQVLHGSATVPSWSAVSLTADVTGVLPLANGGTNKNATAVNGGLVWSDTDSLEITAAGTASQWVLSGGAGTPTMTNTTTTGKLIDGSSDQIQLQVQGNATQTNEILNVEKSDGTDLLLVTNVNGTQIRGTTTNDNAATGFVGEFTTSARLKSNAVSLTTNTTANVGVASLNLTAGDWDVEGALVFIPGATTSITQLVAGISLTSATLPADDTYGVGTAGEIRMQYSSAASVPANEITIAIPRVRVSISASTSYYLVARAVFTLSTMTAAGQLTARRVR